MNSATSDFNSFNPISAENFFKLPIVQNIINKLNELDSDFRVSLDCETEYNVVNSFKKESVLLYCFNAKLKNYNFQFYFEVHPNGTDGKFSLVSKNNSLVNIDNFLIYKNESISNFINKNKKMNLSGTRNDLNKFFNLNF